MHRLIKTLLCLFLPACIVWADVDTKDGTAITSTVNLDGFTSNIDDYDGQVVKTATAAFSCGAELLCEDFEGNDTCANLGWTVVNVVDCQGTTNKQGSYGSEINDDGSNSELKKGFTDNDDVFIKFNLYIDDVSGSNYIVQIRHTNNGSQKMDILLNVDDIGVRWEGESFVYDADTMSAGWWTMKLKHENDSGANDGAWYFWYAAGYNQSLSTATGAADLSGTGLTGTNQPDGLVLMCSEASETVFFDNIVVDTTDPDA
jgi:hypothetical protein